MVVESARVEPAVRPLEIGEGRSGFPSVPAIDKGPVYLIDSVVSDEEVHVEAGAEVRLRIYGVSEGGTFEEQDSDISEGSQESTEFGVPDLLNQFRGAESPGGLLADPHRDTAGAPEDGGEQEIDIVGGRAVQKPIELLVRQDPWKTLLGKRGTEQRIEVRSGATHAHMPIVSFRSMYRLRKIVRLSYRDYAILGETILFAVPVELGLRLVGFDKLVRRLGRVRRSLPRSPTPLDGERAARLVEAVSRLYPFNATCLKKSLVLFWMFRRRGLPAELRIGVRKVDGKLEAHAWIEQGGRVLFDEDTASQFAPMPLNI